MECTICKFGNSTPGKVTVTLEREGTIVIIKDVPADICENCGEYYLSETVTERVLIIAETAIKQHAEVQILKYAA